MVKIKQNLKIDYLYIAISKCIYVSDLSRVWCITNNIVLELFLWNNHSLISYQVSKLYQIRFCTPLIFQNMIKTGFSLRNRNLNHKIFRPRLKKTLVLVTSRVWKYRPRLNTVNINYLKPRFNVEKIP